MRHLHGRTQGGFLREQGGVDDLDLVGRVCTTGHERECVLAAYQSYLDIDAVDQETILQDQDHVESSHHDSARCVFIEPRTPDSQHPSISMASMRSAVATSWPRYRNSAAFR